PFADLVLKAHRVPIMNVWQWNGRDGVRRIIPVGIDEQELLEWHARVSLGLVVREQTLVDAAVRREARERSLVAGGLRIGAAGRVAPQSLEVLVVDGARDERPSPAVDPHLAVLFERRARSVSVRVEQVNPARGASGEA